MNKTLDINIANQIFHIDEMAYKILKKYLDDIKTYLSNEESRDEIIQDIEARIAELFIERMISDKQVINIDDVNEVIKVMGQPEDYDLSENEGQNTYRSQKTDKKLYRDKESAYISGVSAGIGHYLDVEPIWIRVLFILLTFLSVGWLILVYILLWILIPEAKTTAEKLAMRGEPINLSNIEKKIKEGYENVSEKFKGVDVKKQSKKAQSSISSFFSQLEKVLIGIGKIIVKLIGFFLMLISGIGLLAMIFSALGIGGIGLFSSVDFDSYIRLDGFINSILPTWLILTSIFISAFIPLIFIFIFSLKMLFSNIKRPNLTFIIFMITIWIFSIATLIFAAINSQARNKLRGEVVETNALALKAEDTLFIKMRGNLNFTDSPFRNNESIITYDEDNNKLIYDSDVDVEFHTTTESESFVRISKWTRDYEIDEARNQSKTIDYQYEFKGNEIILNAYMLAPVDMRYNSRGVDIDIYIPQNVIISMNENLENFLKNRFDNDDIEQAFEKFYTLNNDRLMCINCGESILEEEIIEESGNQNN